MCLGSPSSTHLTLIHESILNPDNLEAGSRVYQKYSQIIRQGVLSQGISGEDVEDIVQETMQRMITGFWKFTHRRKGSFRAWLRRITRSATADWFRKNPKLQDSPVREVAHTIAMSLVREYNTEILEIAVRKVRLEVHPSHWDMFEKVRLQGQNASEIGESYGVTVYAVYKAGMRVATRLREILEELDRRGLRE